MYREGILKGDAVKTYKIGILLFVWHGGAYIDILIESLYAKDVKIFNEWYTYSDQCINVYDYGEGRVSIPNTEDAFRDECGKWIGQKDWVRK